MLLLCAIHLNRLISRVAMLIIFKRSIKPRPFIRRERNALAQPLYQIWITREEPAKDKGIIQAGFQHAPGVFVVPATAREKGGRTENLAEAGEVDVGQAPAFQELVFFFIAENLLVTLFGQFAYSKSMFKGNVQVR